jgi:Na+/H+-dicarboxylate symporter
MMRKSVRKLIGTVVLLALIIVYALVAMAIAEGRIRDAPALVQTVVYIVLGLAWVLPAMPLIRWMEKPDPEPR